MEKEIVVILQIKINEKYYNQLRVKKGTKQTWEQFLMKEIFFVDVPKRKSGKRRK